ncbi:AbrB/MazE/SpoVT family DNA-binding domain-containing protein [Agrobacterium rubi]|nr:AbrB/MazE/SpoVT family DNA-binding domain-containing protein [Agrobacterium rubi]NTF24487.1 AbrB/MazE/SpoVT family DNA-binding domain-containing protein [Agrobacterium rubi]
MAEQGSLAITARGDGNRWYGRVSIPESVARKANIREGMRVNARCVDGLIIIAPEDQGRIKFPGAKGKGSPRHAFEAATSTLGLREVKMDQAAAAIWVEDGAVKIRVPEDCLAPGTKSTKKIRKDPPRAPATPARSMATATFGVHGTAKALMIEANRAGKEVRAMSLPDIIKLLRDAGRTVEVQGPRFYRIDGVSANIADLLEVARKVSGDTEQNRIALIME